jgi:RNA-directed DNA polymerase
MSYGTEELHGLPLIQSMTSRRDVAERLGVSLQTLTWLLYRNGTEGYYRTWRISKKSGGVREIRAPRSTLYRIQSGLSQVLQDAYAPKPAAHGFVRGRSVVTNATAHVARRYVLNVDIKDFFPSINFGRVRGLFMSRPFELPGEVASLLAAICCSQGTLPIGAPTSPVVANMICLRLDSELQALARDNGCWYTRYADDLTFSTSRRSFPRALAGVDDESRTFVGDELRHRVESNGFALNPAKTRLQTRDTRQSVTGLVVNERMNVDRRFIRRVRAMLHAWDKYGLERAQAYLSHWDKRDRYPGASPRFEDILRGRIAYLAMVRGGSDPLALRFKAQYENLRATGSIAAALAAPSGGMDGREVVDVPGAELEVERTEQEQSEAGLQEWPLEPGLPDARQFEARPAEAEVGVEAIPLLAGLPEGFKARWNGRDDRVARSVYHAIDLFERGSREDLRSAVTELAGILEERRNLLRTELVSRDEGALFNIANKFDIRHRNADQATDYRIEFLEWIFWWYLHTVDLSERLLFAQSANDEDDGPSGA